jgi:NADPH-dependent 2,4-dienoyl-CoA reductase/sulfur reductase-like enzyme
VHVAIIGNGVTGVSAALRVRRRRPDWRISLISGESRFHWSRPALMYIFMGHMGYKETKPFPDSFWVEQRIDLVRGWVTRVDVQQQCLELQGQSPIGWDRLLIASGSRPNRFDWPGQDLVGVQGLYGLQDLVTLYENVERTERAVIVGGGLIGIELAEMLHSRNIGVRFLARESSYCNNMLNDEESEMVNRLVRGYGIDLELDVELDSIEDDGSGRCAAARSTDGRSHECQLVGLTAGVSPNVGFLERSQVDIGRGVLVDTRLRTTASNVWAAGDCAEIVTRGKGPNLIQQVWYTGKKQGEVVGDNIAGDVERDYDPGIWFNSAKFFDLEYQSYGLVNRGVPGERNLFWESDDHRHSARIVSAGGAVIGLQTMGLRWRHEIAERWIREERSVLDLLDALDEITFDPELERRYGPQIARAFREQFS